MAKKLCKHCKQPFILNEIGLCHECDTDYIEHISEFGIEYIPRSTK